MYTLCGDMYPRSHSLILRLLGGGHLVRLPLIIFVLSILSLFLAYPLSADMIVELDLDGQLGNGPDTIAVSPGDSIAVDVWIKGDQFGGFFWSFGCYLIDSGVLDLIDAEVFPLTWTPLPITETGDTVFVSAWDPWLSGVPGPTLQAASVTYEVAAESGFGILKTDLSRSFYMIYGFTATFDDYVGAHVTIQGTTGIEESSWGDIKQLFR